MKVYLNELLFQISYALDCVERDLLNVSTNHSKRVAYMCILLGRRFGLSAEEQVDLACSAVLHDNALTEYILSESVGRGEKIKNINTAKHCQLGEKNAASFPFIGDTKGYILYHHENADGSGPFSKKAGEIPLGAKLIRIADSVDVSFALGKEGEGKFERMQQHVKKFTGSLYEKEIADGFLEEITEDAIASMKNKEIDGSLKNVLPEAMEACPMERLEGFSKTISKIVDYKSPFTKEHSYQIAEKSKIMADYYGFDEDTKLKFYLAAAFHDIGKLATPVEILEKPGSLTEDEFTIMKRHAKDTYLMLSQISGFEQITIWACSHHEKLDGTGYPFGKTGDELDFISRLLACIDIYQALSEDRPYRKGMSHKKSMEIIYDMASQGKIDSHIPGDLDKMLGTQ